MVIYFTCIMYFRRKKTPSGEVLQLLESYRNAEGNPRSQIVVSLGNAKIPEGYWGVIATSVSSALYGHQQLIQDDIPKQARPWIDSILKRVQREGRWSPAHKSLGKIPANGQAKQKTKDEDKDKDKGEVIDGVLLDKVSHTHATSLGPTLLGLKVWENLGMTKCLSRLGFNKAQCEAAATTVINRLVDPVTENFLVENWLPNSAIPDLLGEEVLKGPRKRFYSVSDKLLLNQEAIEAHLRQSQERHFNLTRTLVLYDLTNTHFEGECRSNKKAKRGKNKQKRNDCCQVVVGMILDEFGFELGHKTFDGNLNDSQSLVKMIDSLQKICTKDDELISSVKPLIIVDAGVATQKNLKLLRKKGYRYLVNDSRRKRSKYREAFSQSADFTKISDRFKNGQEKPSVEVKLIEETSTQTELVDQVQVDGSTRQVKQQSSFTEHLVLCKSNSRRNKELAMVSTAEKRFLQQLKALSERIEKGRLKDPVKIERAIGRIKTKNPRVATFYKVTHENKSSADKDVKNASKEKGSENKDVKNASVKKSIEIKSTIQWQRDDKKFHANDDLLGCYVLRTDRLDLTAEQYWQVYMSLTYAEDGFRALKSDLGLRPNHHRIERRVDGHIFISILAYHLLHHILYTLRLKGDRRCWFTLRQILQTHSYTTIVMPTVSGKIYRLRKPGIPEECQRQIYDQFGINMSELPTSKIIIENSKL